MLDTPQRCQIAQNRDRESYLSSLVINLAGTCVVLDLLLRIGIGELKSATFFIGKAKGEGSHVCVKLRLIFDTNGIGQRLLLANTKQILRKRIEKHDFCRSVAYHNGITDAFNDYVQTVAILTDYFLSRTQLLVVRTQFLVSPAEIGDIAHHRNHA